MRGRRGGRPKIADLLAGPQGELARKLIQVARDINVAPTLFLGLRFPTTTLIYGDPDHPDRVTQQIGSAAFTDEDRGLLLGLRKWEAGLCTGCHEPREIAWHSDMDGFYDGAKYVCHACTARDGGERKVIYSIAKTSRDFEARPLPPFELGVTTTSE